MARIVALFNQAGGVGKSTLTLNLGYHLAQQNLKVLLVDLDPQGSLTSFMGIEPGRLEKTIYNSIVEEESLPIHYDINDVDIVPTNLDLSGAELALVMADMREFRLKEALKPVRNLYDYILIDCPPSLGILSFISLVASTDVLIPIQTHNKALRGTELLFHTLTRVKRKTNPELAIAGVVPTMYDSRTAQDKRSLRSIMNLSEHIPILSTIPIAIAFADASEKGVPLAIYDSKHEAVNILNQIAKTLVQQKFENYEY